MESDSGRHQPDAAEGPVENMKIIDLEFETLRQFREVMAPRLSYEGFFIATDKPLPTGTKARFRFLLPDGFVLAEGIGVVAWARRPETDPDLQPGMALWFDDIEHQSREILDELIDFHIATGGDPFDIGPRSGQPGDIGTDALGGEPFEDYDQAPVEEAPVKPDAAGAADQDAGADRSGEDVIPEWLSQVANEHDVDLSSERDGPSEVIDDAPVTREAEPEQQQYEISLMPEENGFNETPMYSSAADAAEVTITPRPKQRAPKGFRPWPLIAIAVVLIAASVAAWWFVNRRADARIAAQSVVEVEPLAELTEQVEQIGQGENVAPEGQVDDEGSQQAPAKPSAVSETAFEPPRIDTVSGPATRVLLVAATRVADSTVISVRANGKLSESSVRLSKLDDPPRLWIRIFGIETFYRPNEIEVGSPEVLQVRVGHHPEETPQSLYVVIDLADPTAVAREHDVDGDTLRVVVGRL
jgi:hypothetical protein